jgi:glyoxylase-like metal-dependent hydrolase (beta-lactamase superfamily II)
METHIIDLNFLDTQETIACFLIKSNEGLILIETGPESTFEQLKLGIEKLGFHLSEIKNVFLTHIHFDHAGAAWKLAQQGAKIHVHPVGLPHLASPEKLWNSAAQIYGSDMERLWGKMEPISEDLLVPVSHLQQIKIGKVNVEAYHTPGHAVHHIAWKIENAMFTGDIAGVCINNGPVVPPCPPPDIHLEDWNTSLDLILSSSATHLYLTHYGKITNKESHIYALRARLNDWSQWIKKYFDEGEEISSLTPRFSEYVQNNMINEGCNSHQFKLYEYANPSWMSVAGLMRYWKQKSLGKI